MPTVDAPSCVRRLPPVSLGRGEVLVQMLSGELGEVGGVCSTVWPAGLSCGP